MFPGSMEPLYFDYNATTPLRVCARNAWLESVNAAWANPSSPHSAGARARNRLEAARAQLGKRLAVDPDRIVFTSGATEGNERIIQRLAPLEPESSHWYSATEHPSVIEASHSYFGKRSKKIPVNESGWVDLDWMKEQVEAGEQVALISIMSANNETGIIQPMASLKSFIRANGFRLHCDLVQEIGKHRLAEVEPGEFAVGTAHKFGGPKGIGFMILESTQSVLKGFHQGDQEGGVRAGTENLAGIEAMVAGLEEAMKEEEGGCLEGRSLFEQRMKKLGATIVGETVLRLDQTSMLLMPRFGNNRWIGRLDKKGFIVSSGSACATGKEGPSHVLSAMGIDSMAALRAIRVSGSRSYGVDQWLRLAQAFEAVYDDLKAAESEDGTSDVIVIP